MNWFSKHTTLRYSLTNSLCSLKIFWDNGLLSGVAGLKCGSKNKCMESRSIVTSLSEQFTVEVDASDVGNADVLSVTVNLSLP